MEIYEKLVKICKTEQNVNLKKLCSIHIGGIGKCLCFPNSIKQIKKLIKFLRKNKLEYYVIGNGTNIVFEDSGYNGVLISLKHFNKISSIDNNLSCFAGANLFAINIFCKNEGLSGLEWSYGIPASIGGAVYMNAGAYDSEIKDSIKYVWALKNGKIIKYKNKDLNFSYRHSLFQENNDIILKVEFELQKADSNLINEKMNEIFSHRKLTQPYGTFNCGSVFKKTVQGSAGKTIDKLGLKGVKIGDIEISHIHANFFINNGNGKSEDLRKLISMVKYKVFKSENINLKEEVIFIENKKE